MAENFIDCYYRLSHCSDCFGDSTTDGHSNQTALSQKPNLIEMLPCHFSRLTAHAPRTSAHSNFRSARQCSNVWRREKIPERTKKTEIKNNWFEGTGMCVCSRPATRKRSGRERENKNKRQNLNRRHLRARCAEIDDGFLSSIQTFSTFNPEYVHIIIGFVFFLLLLSRRSCLSFVAFISFRFHFG